jgi:hypothetical protein
LTIPERPLLTPGDGLSLPGAEIMWRTAESFILYTASWAFVFALVAGGFYVLF